MPPMALFKAARVKDQWHEAAPSGYMIKATESGYINADVFTDYGKHFVTFLKKETYGDLTKNTLYCCTSTKAISSMSNICDG